MPNLPAFTALLALTESTRSIRPRESDPKVSTLRSFARWLKPEQQLLEALKLHSRSNVEIAAVLQRTVYAVELKSPGRFRPNLGDLPHSNVRWCDADVQLLEQWTDIPTRDPLGWWAGDTLPEKLWLPSERPTLRVIQVSREQSLQPDTSSESWRLILADVELATQGVWTDLAAQMVQTGGRVIMPHDDSTSSLRRQLRRAIERTIGHVPPRNSVVTLSASDRSRKPLGVVLLDRPLLWKPPQLRRLSDAQTILLVLPDLQQSGIPRLVTSGGAAAGGQYYGGSTLPLSVRYQNESAIEWTKHVQREGERNRALIQAWSAGRDIENYTFQGVPNTAGLPARLDWPALRLLPEQGQVVSAQPDLLLRAAAWYQLVSGQQPSVPPDLLEALAWISEAVRGTSAFWASERLAKQMQDRSLTEQVLARCWLDTLYAPSQQQSQLKFVLGTPKLMHYIGH